MDERIHLSLQGAEDGEPVASAGAEEPVLKDHPVIGYLAVACGVLSIFHWGVLFVPMGLAFSISALIAGQGGWGFGGLLLTTIGFMTSPTLLALLGLGALAAFVGFPGF